jgi:GNAT superfamily N-acetyltransferase
VSAEVIARKIALNEFVVAETMVEPDDRPVGSLCLEYRRSTNPYIALIRVREELRGRGIGRAILAFLEGFVRGGGHLVLPSSSQAWHWAAGFEECGILVGIDEGEVGELFFRKRLR